MNNNDFNYFLIGNICFGDVPLMVNDDEHDSFGVGIFARYEKVLPDFVAHIAFNPTIRIPKPRLVDAMSLRGDCCVFSRKIYNVLSKHEIKGLQLVPTVIRGKNDEEFDNFWITNIYQKMAFFDEKETEYDYVSELTGAWQDIEKIVLDKEKLAKVPLKDRLVFVSKENPAFIFYHKSVVDIIMSANPEGIVFTPVEEWYDGIQFDR